jgi:hypothetical protein
MEDTPEGSEMSTVADATAVDRVARNDDGRLLLYIIVTLTWGDGGDEQVDQLMAKLNAYQSWVASGECQRQYPDAGNGIDIVVVCLDEPHGRAAELLLAAREGLQKRGIGCYYQAVAD